MSEPTTDNIGSIQLWSQLERLAVSSGDRLALMQPDAADVSFGQLWSMLEAIEEVLRHAHVHPWETVAVILPDGLCGLISLLGVARVCACSPLNPELTEAELEADLLSLGATAVITAPALDIPLRVAGRLGLTMMEAAISETGCEWRIKQCPVASSEAPGPARDLGDATLLLHTSATTGRRKLVPISPGNLQAMLENTAQALRLGPGDRLLSMARLFHTQGVLSPLAQLLAGGSVIVLPGYTTHSFRRCMEMLQPTWYACGPTLHRAILSHLEEKPLDPRASLRFVRSGGATLPEDLRERLEAALHVPVLDVYGLTETGAVACTTVETLLGKAGSPETRSVGRSMGPEIAVIGADGALLAAGEEGEIVVSGPTVMAGYRNDPDANREAFQGRWFRTGDLGHLDFGGFLYVTGRLKEIINRGGQKIIPDEIDRALAAHAAVREAVAFGVTHPTLGEDVACAVVLREGCDVIEAELREFAAKRLAAFKLPRKIYQVESIPHGATGKPQRLVLRMRFEQAHQLQLGAASSQSGFLQSPRDDVAAGEMDAQASRESSRPTDLERSLEDVWCRCLNIDHAGRDVDFYGAGGDSLSAMTMLSEVERLLGLRMGLPQPAFFADPTLGTLIGITAEALSGRSAVESSSAMIVVPVTKGSGRQRLFMLPADGEEGCSFRLLSRQLAPSWGLSLVRPENCWHARSVVAIEEAAAQAVAAIRVASPEGPYVLGGYCYGGVVAFETVRQLAAMGESARLVLLDVPMPGYPRPLLEWQTYLRAIVRTAEDAWESKKLRPLLALTDRLMRRTMWFALRRARPRKTGFWGFVPAHWLCRQAQKGYFSFYEPSQIDAPVLHFLAEYEHDILMAESRCGWQCHVRQGVAKEMLAGGHDSVFDEGNLRQVAHALSAWLH